MDLILSGGDVDVARFVLCDFATPQKVVIPDSTAYMVRISFISS